MNDDFTHVTNICDTKDYVIVKFLVTELSIAEAPFQIVSGVNQGSLA